LAITSEQADGNSADRDSATLRAAQGSTFRMFNADMLRPKEEASPAERQQKEEWQTYARALIQEAMIRVAPGSKEYFELQELLERANDPRTSPVELSRLTQSATTLVTSYESGSSSGSTNAAGSVARQAAYYDTEEYQQQQRQWIDHYMRQDFTQSPHVNQATQEVTDAAGFAKQFDFKPFQVPYIKQETELGLKAPEIGSVQTFVKNDPVAAAVREHGFNQPTPQLQAKGIVDTHGSGVLAISRVTKPEEREAFAKTHGKLAQDLYDNGKLSEEQYLKEKRFVWMVRAGEIPADKLEEFLKARGALEAKIKAGEKPTAEEIERYTGLRDKTADEAVKRYNLTTSVAISQSSPEKQAEFRRKAAELGIEVDTMERGGQRIPRSDADIVKDLREKYGTSMALGLKPETREEAVKIQAQIKAVYATLDEPGQSFEDRRATTVKQSFALPEAVRFLDAKFTQNADGTQGSTKEIDKYFYYKTDDKGNFVYGADGNHVQKTTDERFDFIREQYEKATGQKLANADGSLTDAGKLIKHDLTILKGPEDFGKYIAVTVTAEKTGNPDELNQFRLQKSQEHSKLQHDLAKAGSLPIAELPKYLDGYRNSAILGVALEGAEKLKKTDPVLARDFTASVAYASHQQVMGSDKSTSYMHALQLLRQSPDPQAKAMLDSMQVELAKANAGTSGLKIEQTDNGTTRITSATPGGRIKATINQTSEGAVISNPVAVPAEPTQAPALPLPLPGQTQSPIPQSSSAPLHQSPIPAPPTAPQTPVPQQAPSTYDEFFSTWNKAVAPLTGGDISNPNVDSAPKVAIRETLGKDSVVYSTMANVKWGFNKALSWATGSSDDTQTKLAEAEAEKKKLEAQPPITASTIPADAVAAQKQALAAVSGTLKTNVANSTPSLDDTGTSQTLQIAKAEEDKKEAAKKPAVDAADAAKMLAAHADKGEPKDKPANSNEEKPKQDVAAAATEAAKGAAKAGASKPEEAKTPEGPKPVAVAAAAQSPAGGARGAAG
jgi:hypothetical protein